MAVPSRPAPPAAWAPPSRRRAGEPRLNRSGSAHLLLFLALLAGLLLFPIAASGQVGATTDILRGRLVDEEGNPVAGAIVEAWSLESGVRRQTSSGRDGVYTLLFPDGGGSYRLRVTMIGRAPYEVEFRRIGDEEVLVHDVRLQARAVELGGVVAQGRRTLPPGRGDDGAITRGLDGALAERLPIQSTDPASIAALAPGVVSLPGADSLGGGGGFSIAGQRASQNQVTLDGASFSSMLGGGAMGGGLGLPQEGMRSTQVITSTYDVARGHFSGGQVAMSTRSGPSIHQGSLSYGLGDSRLEGGGSRSDWMEGFQQNRLSGGVGGPIITDRLFYNLSFVAQRREEGMMALTPRSPSGYGRAGVHADSVSRFLDILDRVYGISPERQAGPYDRASDGMSVLGRVDFNLRARQTVSLRGFGSGSSTRGAFVGPLETIESGGDASGGMAGVIGTLTSQLGTSWINEARLSYTGQTQEMISHTSLPEARVRVSSMEESGESRVSSLVFGGDPFPPRSSSERTLEVANELSWLAGPWHRLKLGLVLNRTDFDQEMTTARSGIFHFNSLADLERGRASSFTRSLLEGPVTGSGWSAAVYLGDTWRLTDALQLVLGVRAEASGFEEAPGAGADGGAALGLNRDALPSELRVSPLLGFSWRLSDPGEALRILRGGFGEFRGRTPYSLYAGILGGEPHRPDALLSCVGEGRVPAPDFQGFRASPLAIPATCADGGLGEPGSGGLSNLAGFANGFESPRTWRASLGFQASLRPALSVSLDAMYARGAGQYGVRDLNLAPAPAFLLDAEGGRPVFATADRIDPASAWIPLAASRQDPRYGGVYEVHSELESEAGSLTLAASGILPARRISFQAAYTLGYARDQSSFTFGGPAQGFGRTVTPGDPNRFGWAWGDMDRRHNLTGVVGMPLGSAWSVSVIGSGISGAPYTPRVAGDINGDGGRNDSAFIFDPTGPGDPGLAAAMDRLLQNAPGNAARCLREQLGALAARNSCRGEWSVGLDVRLGFAPRIGTLGRRMSFGVELFDLPAGLDLMLHGSDGSRGWGRTRARVDDVLLHPRSFDPAARSFAYEVNERFGRQMRHAMGLPSSFGIRLSGRLAIGPDPAPDPLGGFAGLGLGGGGGGVMVTRTAGAAPQGGPEASAGGPTIRIAGTGDGQGPSVAGMLDSFLPMRLPEIVALGESIGASPEQLRRLEEIRDWLLEVNTPIRAEVGRTLSGNAAAPTNNPAALFDRIGPRLNEGRQNVQTALDQVRETLTPEQWERIPEELRRLPTATIRMR
jgi:hypothetical protein